MVGVYFASLKQTLILDQTIYTSVTIEPKTAVHETQSNGATE